MLHPTDDYTLVLDNFPEVLDESWFAKSLPYHALALDHLEFLLRAWRSEHDFCATQPIARYKNYELRQDDVKRILRAINDDLYRISPRPNLIARIDYILLDIELLIQQLNDLEIMKQPPHLPSLQTSGDLKLPFDTASLEQLSDVDPAARRDDNDDLDIVELMLETEQTTLDAELLRACRLGHEDIVHYVLAKRTYEDIGDLGDDNGRTPLHLASLHDRPNILEVLVRNIKSLQNPDHFLKREDKDGYTPLHLAASQGSRNSVEQLLLAEVPHDIPIRTGETALDLAIRQGFVEVIELLNEGTKGGVYLRNSTNTIRTPLRQVGNPSCAICRRQ